MRPQTCWLRAAPTSLDFFPSDLNLMGTKSWKYQLTTSIQSWEEGRCLIFLGMSLGSSLISTRAGRAKTLHNQLLTGNISYSTLLVFFGGRVDGERISAAAYPQWTLFAKAKARGPIRRNRSNRLKTGHGADSGTWNIVSCRVAKSKQTFQAIKIAIFR